MLHFSECFLIISDYPSEDDDEEEEEEEEEEEQGQEEKDDEQQQDIEQPPASAPEEIEREIGESVSTGEHHPNSTYLCVNRSCKPTKNTETHYSLTTFFQANITHLLHFS